MKVSSKHDDTVLRLWIELTESVSYTYGKVKTWFEEIFEEYVV
ncbi:chlorohydrolase [Streptococcus pneumoniae]|nr:chlorohydrolase [Streptococcus pneumoniae]